jgi:hypothetical protein
MGPAAGVAPASAGLQDRSWDCSRHAGRTGTPVTVGVNLWEPWRTRSGWPRLSQACHVQGMVESEVVATSPNRIKSPMPVCCGFDSVENGARGRIRTRTVDALDVVPRWPRANAWATRAIGAPGRIRTFNRAPVRCFPRIRRSLCRLSYWGGENGGMPWTCATCPKACTG